MGILEQLAVVDRAHRAEANFEKTLVLLHLLKSGGVSLGEVALTADGWKYEPAAVVTSEAPVSGSPPDFDLPLGRRATFTNHAGVDGRE